MAPRRPRFSVGVLAICCGFLSLTVVAREATPSSSFLPSTTPPTSYPLSATGGDAASRKYAIIHHQQQQQRVHPGVSSAPPQAGGLLAMPVLTTPLSSVPSQMLESKRHRKTRETFPLSRPVTTGEELEPGSTQGSPERVARRRRMEPNLGSLSSRLVFVPSRGRRYGSIGVPAEKRQLTIEQMLEKGDYFVPNRGKKAPAASSGGTGELMIKKGKFDVLLGTPGSADEYFFPNRGKKEYFVAYEPLGSGGSRGTPSFESKLVRGFGGEGRHPTESRLRRNLLENLVNEHKDTFFSSRGKRIRPGTADGMILWPSDPLPADEREVPSDEGGTGTEHFSSQPDDLESALLWNDAVPLFPLEFPRPSS